MRLTPEIINERLAPRGITLIGEYRRSVDHTQFRCAHGHVWSATYAKVGAGTGCPECLADSLKLSTEEINRRLAPQGITVVGPYKNANALTKFRCSFGHTWEGKYGNVYSGNRCPHCAGRAKLDAAEINRRLADRGLRILEEPVSTMKPARFGCSEGHEWTTTPGNVLHRSGCPTCAVYGFDSNAPAILYYLRIDADCGTFYKIGITSHTVEERFAGCDLDIICTLKTWDFDTGAEAKVRESEVLRTFEAHRVDLDLLRAGGNTELFDRDVLGLDSRKIAAA